MKKSNLVLVLITLSLYSMTLFGTTWQDILGQLTNFPKKVSLPSQSSKPTRSKSSSSSDFDLEHAQKLAQRSIIHANEAANSSASAIKNITLHLDNLHKINAVVEHLSNVMNARGNSLEETELAKQTLHEVLSESKKLEKNAHEATQQLEKTLRITTRLNQRLKSTQSILNPTFAKILDTLKTNSLDKSV